MKRSANLIGGGRNDCTGLEQLALAPLAAPPALPQTGEGERLGARELEQVRQLLLAFLFPFIKTVGQDQAAATGQRGTEGGFFSQRFRAGVDQAGRNLRVFSPAW